MQEAFIFDPPDPARPVVACDVEGTLSGGETWHGMRDYLIATGRANAYRHFQRGRLFAVLRYRLGLMRNTQAFKEEWVLGLLRLFQGMARSELAEAGEWIVTHELWPQRRRQLISELHAYLAQGARVVLVSGMFEPFLAPLLQRLPGAEALGTPVRYAGEVFQGDIADKLNVGERKVARLLPYTGRDRRLLAAYGDTQHDIPMLALSEHPVAVHPDEKLREEAQHRGWRILEESEDDQKAN